MSSDSNNPISENLSDGDQLNDEDSGKDGNNDKNNLESSLSGNNEENMEPSLSENDENDIVSNPDSDDSLEAKNKKNTTITVKSTSILRGTHLYVFLKDANGNALANKTLLLTFNNAVYNKTTDDNGRVSLKISSAKLGNYTLIVNFNGDSSYKSSNKTCKIHVYHIETHITVNSLTILRGNSLNVYLRDTNNNTIPGQNISITFRGTKYTKTTDSNGKVSLKISSAPAGNYSTKINFEGNPSYTASNRSFTLTVKWYETHITVNSLTIIRGNHLYVYLRDNESKTIPGQSITITFNGKTYAKTTDSNGRCSLKISSAPAGKYSTKINFEGKGCYAPSSRSFTLTVKWYETHITVNSKIIVKGSYLYATLRNSSSKTISGQSISITFRGTKYTKTTDSNGKVSLKISSAPIGKYSIKINFAGKDCYAPSSRSFTLTVTGGGSGKKITQKTIVIDTDHIFSESKDKKFMNDLAAALKAKGYKVIVAGRGPNAHCNDLTSGKYSNACLLCLFGGADSGMFVDMSSNWYQNTLKQYNDRVVLGFLVPPNTVNLANCTYLKRAHDDDYSSDDFVGLEYPGLYLNQHGMDYIYGRSASEMANNFVNYAKNGASIGLNNTLPKF